MVLAPVDPDQVRPVLSAAQPDALAASPLVPQAAGDRPSLRLLRRVGQVDPGSLDSYRAAGGYEMLRRAVAEGPQGVLRKLKDAKLLGRGCAAFPTAVKWEAVPTNPARPHYVVCNADESEPGTFKDRVLMEEDPYALLEALTIMGYTCGGRAGLHLHPGRVPAGGGPAAACRRAGVPVLTEATAMIASYLTMERQLGRIAADADVDTLAATLIGAGHLLFAGRNHTTPEAGAVHKVVTTVIAGVVQEPQL